MGGGGAGRGASGEVVGELGWAVGAGRIEGGVVLG